MTGWKTFAFGAAMVVVPPLLNFIGAFDFSKLGLSPGTSAAIGAIIIGLRAVTSTPMFSKS